MSIKLSETEKRVLEVLKQRQMLSRQRYKDDGFTYKQKSAIEWIDEAIEEAADMLQYLVAMKMRFEEENK